MKIKIVNKGAEILSDAKYIYIGRPSILSNPFPTKYSKFSSLIYTHEKSMTMYLKYLEKQVLDNNPEIMKELKRIIKKNLIISCFCIVKELDEKNINKNFNPVEAKCHGEVISYIIFKYKQKILEYQ